MTASRNLLAALPPFLAGVVMAVVLETSTGLLLYVEEGFLPALTLILVVESGAVALGLWTGLSPSERTAIEQVRRRWVVALVIFAGAAGFSALSGFWWGASGRPGIGLGWDLAVLGALPLFSVASLLGAMSRRDSLTKTPIAMVGIPSVVGLSAGFLLAGGILLPNTVPHTLYLLCLVALSGGALLQGWVLDARPLQEVKAQTWTEMGELRAEERVLGRPRREVRVVTEGGRLRGAEDWEGMPERKWERAILDGLSRGSGSLRSLLYVGGGSGTLVRLLSQRRPELAIHVLERTDELVAFAREHLLDWDRWEEIRFQTGDPFQNLNLQDRAWSLVLVDCGILPSFGNQPFLSRDEWRALADATDSGGWLIMGGLPYLSGQGSRPLMRLMREGKRVFGEAEVLRTAAPAGGATILPGEDGAGGDAILVFSRGGGNVADVVSSDLAHIEIEEA